MKHLREVTTLNRSGAAVAIPSVCSAHPDVIEASCRLALENGTALLVEATSNQVNQFGGYTGMKPLDFRLFVAEIAAKVGLGQDQLYLGGDHLGPQAWKSEPADSAMAKAEEMLAAYVAAGFTKIHLDCSEGCKGEPASVSDAVAAERASQLAAICEKAAPDPEALTYVVGTEVPPPGGARAEDSHDILPTSPNAAKKTMQLHQEAFERRGIGHAWKRVAGLVVQPGLEFAPDHITRFHIKNPNELSSAIADCTHIAFEAHSTDYQKDEVFPELARRNFAVLKVGPALTFAWREGLFALDHIRAWLLPEKQSLQALIEAEMCRDPGYWRDHYLGNTTELRLLRAFSYADRIRYYWPKPYIANATNELIQDIDQAEVPDQLVSQYFGTDVQERAETIMRSGVPLGRALLQAKVQAALQPYYFNTLRDAG